MLILVFKNQCRYTISNADYSTLKLALPYFSVTNKQSLGLEPNKDREGQSAI